jgi:anti-anti-sigma regulatory factor
LWFSPVVDCGIFPSGAKRLIGNRAASGNARGEGSVTRKTGLSLEESSSIWSRIEETPSESTNARRKVVRGTGDMTNCEEIRALSLKCARAIGSGHGVLVIDLSTVERADTKLMACLVSVVQLARSSSVRLELRSNRTVRELAEFCRLTWLIQHAE